MSPDKLILALAVFTAIAGIAYIGNDPQPQQVPTTVPYVDIPSYMGTWYEQARIPFRWEAGCTEPKAIYTQTSATVLKVDNRCTKNGKESGTVGRAVVEDTVTNSKLKVEFIQSLGIGGAYWIVRLAKDYSYSVVSSPNYKFMWILSREKVMDEGLYRSILADLKKDGFPVEKLEKSV